ncbi:MAG TPA: OsmC family protein [Burkholderiales bacterium]|nr:OsmC family protein [Burkholderiales bacterium]
MNNLPHIYNVKTSAQAEGDVTVEGEGLPSLAINSPAQFGGPGNRWSPEMLLVAALANCIVLSYRAIARASKFNWTHLSCEVDGTLDRVDGVIQFTHFTVRAALTVPAGAREQLALRLLEKAEKTCFVTNSLKAQPTLEAKIVAT